MPRLAAQLYTLRDFTKTWEGFDDVLRTMHGIGYDGVQLSAIGCMGDSLEDAIRARELLDSNGLECCATHRPWNRLRDETEAEIAFHQALRCDYVAIGGLWDDKDSPETYLRFLDESRDVIPRLKAKGIRFGYHNHSHEFARFGPARQRLLDLLIEGGKPDLMMEIDTYWVAHAGADPAALLSRCEGRIPAIHLKDMEIVPGEGPVMAPVGEGNLNWDAILAVPGVEWAIVEQDVCRRDPFDCLASSFEFLSARL